MLGMLGTLEKRREGRRTEQNFTEKWTTPGEQSTFADFQLDKNVTCSEMTAGYISSGAGSGRGQGYSMGHNN